MTYPFVPNLSLKLASLTSAHSLSLLLISRLLLNLRRATCSSGASSETSGFLDVHSPDEREHSSMFFDHEAIDLSKSTSETLEFSSITPTEDLAMPNSERHDILMTRIPGHV